jgi:hypothetical protein
MRESILAAGCLLALGCTSARPAPLPKVSPEQFSLTLDADTEALGRGLPTEIVHRLSNQSEVAVCLGGSWELRLAGEAHLTTVVADGFCDVPLIVIEPGEQGEWRSIAKVSGCLEVADLGFRPPFRYQCGVEVPLEIEIELWRWDGKAPEWGAIRVLSQPILLKRSKDRAADAETRR